MRKDGLFLALILTIGGLAGFLWCVNPELLYQIIGSLTKGFKEGYDAISSWSNGIVSSF